LWYKWQHDDFPDRRIAYEGRAGRNEDRNASLNDIIPMGGLAPDIKVADIMNTNAGIFYYKY